MNPLFTSLRNSIVLGLFAVVTTGGIALTYLGTREDIAAQERAAAEKALLEILPRAQHDNQLLDDVIPVNDDALLGLRDEKAIYIGRQHGDISAILIPATARDGYSGDIDLIVGIYRDGSIAGVRVLKHNETPGLGDKVDIKKSPWVLNFNGKSIGTPPLEQWKVKRDKGAFDQLTGATITPRAVTKAVRNALVYFAENRDTLLAKPREQQP